MKVDIQLPEDSLLALVKDAHGNTVEIAAHMASDPPVYRIIPTTPNPEVNADLEGCYETDTVESIHSQEAS